MTTETYCVDIEVYTVETQTNTTIKVQFVIWFYESKNYHEEKNQKKNKKRTHLKTYSPTPKLFGKLWRILLKFFKNKKMQKQFICFTEAVSVSASLN